MGARLRAHGLQKALALPPPGLAFGVAQANILERARTAAGRGSYFDFLEFEKSPSKPDTQYPGALPPLCAGQQLKRIDAETLPVRWARHEAMARRTWALTAEAMTARHPSIDPGPEGYRS